MAALNSVIKYIFCIKLSISLTELKNVVIPMPHKLSKYVNMAALIHFKHLGESTSFNPILQGPHFMWMIEWMNIDECPSGTGTDFKKKKVVPWFD